DTLRTNQIEQLRLIFKIRARCVTKGIPRALIALTKEPRNFWSVFINNSQLRANDFVPIFRERFRRLDGKAMHIKIIGIRIRFEELLSISAGLATNGNSREGYDIGLVAARGFFFGKEKIGKAQPAGR